MEQELDSLSFEEAMKLLEEAVSKLEQGDLKLEEALSIYEQGQALANYCSKKLESASIRIEQLTSDGEIIDVTLDKKP